MAKASKDPLETPLDIEEDLHFRALAWRLNQLRTDRKKCDLIIKVEGKEIHVHRNVMMAGSDYFDAMFSHDTLENRTGVVEMKDVTFSIVNKLIVFTYTGKIAIIEEECEPLLFAAILMQLTTVCDKIAPFLQNCLSPSTFFNAKRIAVKFSLENLNKICDEYALENLHLLVKEAEFNRLELSSIKFFVSAENLNEDSKIAIILQWIKADVENRRQDLNALSGPLDFGEISSGCGKYIAENEEICYSSSMFMRMLYKGALSQSCAKPMAPSIDNISFKQANSIVVFEKKSKALQAYNLRSRSWKKMHDLHDDMLNEDKYVAVVIKSSIYVLFGSKEVWKIDFTDKAATWTHLPDMIKEHKKDLSAAMHGTRLIYIGGNVTLEKFDILREEWELIDCGGVYVNYCALAVLDGCLYIIGGYKDSKPMKGVAAFSPRSSSWSTISEMLMARQTPSSIVAGDRIYVAGGHNESSLSDVEYYDSKKKS